MAFLTAVVFFFSNVMAVHATESGFWAERRKHAQRSGDGNGAQAWGVLPGAPPDLLFQLPSLETSAPTSSLTPSSAHDLPSGFVLNHAKLLQALPASFGTVRGVAFPDGGDAGKTVVHIHDVHMNAEAQENIGRAVQSLIAGKIAGLVALEGAFEPIDVAPYRAFPDKTVTRHVADYLLRENKISGPVHAALTGESEIPPLIGVDDPRHHRNNVAAYRRCAGIIPRYAGRLASLRRDMARRKAGLFTPGLLAFDRHAEGYRLNAISLGDYAQVLVDRLPAPAPSQLGLFLRTLREERSLDFKRVEKERAGLIEELVRALNPRDIQALVQDSAAYRLGQVSHGDYYRGLQALCRRNGLPLDRFPALDAYLQYVLMAESISGDRLFHDIQEAEKAVYARLAGTPEEKALVSESRFLLLAGKLAGFALTPEEWEDYRGLRGEGSLLGADWPLAPFESFYEEARARDEAMTGKLLSAMREHGAATAVLVTGGFHGPGMAALLRRRGVTLVTFVPRLNRVDTESGSDYLSVFTQEKSPLETLFQGPQLFLAGKPMAEDGLAGTLYRLESLASEHRTPENQQAAGALPGPEMKAPRPQEHGAEAAAVPGGGSSVAVRLRHGPDRIDRVEQLLRTSFMAGLAGVAMTGLVIAFQAQGAPAMALFGATGGLAFLAFRAFASIVLAVGAVWIGTSFARWLAGQSARTQLAAVALSALVAGGCISTTNLPLASTTLSEQLDARGPRPAAAAAYPFEAAWDWFIEDSKKRRFGTTDKFNFDIVLEGEATDLQRTLVMFKALSSDQQWREVGFGFEKPFLKDQYDHFHTPLYFIHWHRERKIDEMAALLAPHVRREAGEDGVRKFESAVSRLKRLVDVALDDTRARDRAALKSAPPPTGDAKTSLGAFSPPMPPNEYEEPSGFPKAPLTKDQEKRYFELLTYGGESSNPLVSVYPYQEESMRRKILDGLIRLSAWSLAGLVEKNPDDPLVRDYLIPRLIKQKDWRSLAEVALVLKSDGSVRDRAVPLVSKHGNAYALAALAPLLPEKDILSRVTPALPPLHADLDENEDWFVLKSWLMVGLALGDHPMVRAKIWPFIRDYHFHEEAWHGMIGELAAGFAGDPAFVKAHILTGDLKSIPNERLFSVADALLAKNPALAGDVLDWVGKHEKGRALTLRLIPRLKGQPLFWERVVPELEKDPAALAELAKANPQDQKLLDHVFQKLLSEAKSHPMVAASHGAFITHSQPEKARELFKAVKAVPEALALWALALPPGDPFFKETLWPRLEDIPAGAKILSWLGPVAAPDPVILEKLSRLVAEDGSLDQRADFLLRMARTKANRALLVSTVLPHHPGLIGDKEGFHLVVKAWAALTGKPFDFEKGIEAITFESFLRPKPPGERLKSWADDRRKVLGDELRKSWDQARWEELNRFARSLKDVKGDPVVQFQKTWDAFLAKDGAAVLPVLDQISADPAHPAREAGRWMLDKIIGTGWSPLLRLIEEAPGRLSSGAATWEQTEASIVAALSAVPPGMREASPARTMYQKALLLLAARVELDRSPDAGLTPAAKAKFIKDLDGMSNFIIGGFASLVIRGGYISLLGAESLALTKDEFLNPGDIPAGLRALRHEMEHALSEKDRNALGDEENDIVTMRAAVIGELHLKETRALSGSPWEMYPTIKTVPDELAQALSNAIFNSTSNPEAADLGKVLKDARGWVDFHVLLREMVRVNPDLAANKLERSFSTYERGKVAVHWSNAVVADEARLAPRTPKAGEFGKNLMLDYLARTPLMNPYKPFTPSEVDFQRLRLDIARARGPAADKVRAALGSNQVSDKSLLAKINALLTAAPLPGARQLHPGMPRPADPWTGKKPATKPEVLIEANKTVLKDLYRLSLHHPMEGLDPARAEIAGRLMMRMYDPTHARAVAAVRQKLQQRGIAWSDEKVDKAARSVVRASLTDLIVRDVKWRDIDEKVAYKGDGKTVYAWVDELERDLLTRFDVEKAADLVFVQGFEPDFWSIDLRPGFEAQFPEEEPLPARTALARRPLSGGGRALLGLSVIFAGVAGWASKGWSATVGLASGVAEQSVPVFAAGFWLGVAGAVFLTAFLMRKQIKNLRGLTQPLMRGFRARRLARALALAMAASSPAMAAEALPQRVLGSIVHLHVGERTQETPDVLTPADLKEAFEKIGWPRLPEGKPPAPALYDFVQRAKVQAGGMALGSGFRSALEKRGGGLVVVGDDTQPEALRAVLKASAETGKPVALVGETPAALSRIRSELSLAREALAVAVDGTGLATPDPIGKIKTMDALDLQNRLEAAPDFLNLFRGVGVGTILVPTDMVVAGWDRLKKGTLLEGAVLMILHAMLAREEEDRRSLEHLRDVVLIATQA